MKFPECRARQHPPECAARQACAAARPEQYARHEGSNVPARDTGSHVRAPAPGNPHEQWESPRHAVTAMCPREDSTKRARGLAQRATRTSDGQTYARRPEQCQSVLEAAGIGPALQPGRAALRVGPWWVSPGIRGGGGAGGVIRARSAIRSGLTWRRLRGGTPPSPRCQSFSSGWSRSTRCFSPYEPPKSIFASAESP